jgi:3-oxoacyl-[acyl-carrier protein] reductase
MESTSASGKVALITGTSRRIGRATALRLADCGADLVIHAKVARDEVEAVAQEVRARGRRALVCMADVTDEASVASMMQAVRDTYGRLDFLVNNASVRRHSPFLSLSLAEWREIISVILDGAFLCSRAALPLMIAGGGGAIVNIGGVTAHVGAMERAHVSTAKAGLIGLTKALAVEFAPAKVRVNCVVPGKIGGQRSATSGRGLVTGEGNEPVLGRTGDVDEVAAIIAAMCLPMSSYMTGQTVHVNGGMYLP